MFRLFLTFSLIYYSIFAHASYCSLCEKESIFKQSYPNQNACKLIENIPKELRNLPYGIYPCENLYNTKRFNFNKLTNLFPHAIFVPRNAEEISFLLKLFTQFDLKFSVRSGGHGYEPNSLCSGYVIDMSNFKTITPDIENKEVFVGSGCVLGEIISTLGIIDYMIPVGDCSEVGIAGLALGGGQGIFNCFLGLTCDNITGITMINSEGIIQEINQETNPDLFWALRGAGHGSFGIILGLKIKMTYLPKMSFFSLSWDWNQALATQIFSTWQSWITRAPSELTTHLYITYVDGKAKIILEGANPGEEICEWKKPFLAFNPHVKTFTGSILDGAHLWIKAHTEPFSKTKSSIAFKPISLSGIETMTSFITKLVQKNVQYNFHFAFSQFGGKIKNGNSAFYPRDALFLWQQMATWEDPSLEKSALSEIRAFHASIKPYVSPYHYTNIVDYDLGDSYLNGYYGDHVDRLIEIKKAHDPANRFHWKQSIPTRK